MLSDFTLYSEHFLLDVGFGYFGPQWRALPNPLDSFVAVRLAAGFIFGFCSC